MKVFLDRLDALDPTALVVTALIVLGCLGLIFALAAYLDARRHRGRT